MSGADYFSLKRKLKSKQKEYTYYDINVLEEKGLGQISRLPFSIKVLLEMAVRKMDERAITRQHVEQIAGWAQGKGKNKEIPFIPARILLQDFTGVPAVVDLAAMRSAVERAGKPSDEINPLIPVDLVIDHSVMVDAFGTPEAIEINVLKEFERNNERYRFLRWAQSAFNNFRVVPPATGIIHQVNLEYLANVVVVKEEDDMLIFPDSLVGTDSHTTMINGIGVLGWGVGGIEAEAGMLGQPLYFLTPEVVGFKLKGNLPKGATATDLALTVTNILRQKGVVGKFVEYFGPGLDHISVEDRATISNMSPEYGATMGFFPVDEETLNYLRSTGRDEEHIALIKDYFKAQGMFHTNDMPDPIFSTTIEMDLSNVVPGLAGPKRPQDFIALKDMKDEFNKVICKPINENGYGLDQEKISRSVELNYSNGKKEKLKTGSVVIASITSCTNTSNPSVMIGAGLVAKKAVELGLSKPAYVKSSLIPGSKVVTEYLKKAGLLKYLEHQGFYVTGYGCGTCIGNSGPLPDEVTNAIVENDLTVASVISGNRNFEGRVHSLIKANYLASPLLVLAYALAGTVDIDLINEPIGVGKDNASVYLKDIWPSPDEINEVIRDSIGPELYKDKYENVFSSNEQWNDIPVNEEKSYKWDEQSTYIQEPPFFINLGVGPDDIKDITNARVLALLGDSVTTDHISPAGSIAFDSPAGKYLLSKGINKEDFNSYGSRRGNHEVMMRGTFANIRIRNQIAPGTEGGVTRHLPTNEIMPMYDASVKFKEENTPLIVLAGKEYGTGSSRDWAAKGVSLLGVKAVIAQSFERIHRSNLVGMGVLPLQFMDGENIKTLGLTGEELFNISGLSNSIKPGQKIKVSASRKDSTQIEFEVIARLDSVVDVDYYRNGGILQTVLRKIIS